VISNAGWCVIVGGSGCSSMEPTEDVALRSTKSRLPARTIRGAAAVKV
jgi:hypothetical protein